MIEGLISSAVGRRKKKPLDSGGHPAQLAVTVRL